MKMTKPSWPMFSPWAISLALIVLAVACTNRVKVPDNPTGPSVTKRDFKDVPPGVESATIQLLDNPVSGGNALLEVVFEPGDARLAKGVPLFLEGKERVLRDDGANGDAKKGDGIFSAIIDFDPAEISAQVAFAARTREKSSPRPIFRGREIIGVEDTEAAAVRLKRVVALRDVEALVRTKTKLNLFDFASLVDPATIDPERSLMITAPSVVQDPLRTIDPCTGAGAPNGVWTFKHLVTEMVAGTGVDPADFVENWLRLWTANQTVSSGSTAPSRSTMLTKIINPWPRIGGKLDLDRSPFRLSAIVNRIDLGGNGVYGGGSAGEGRFVFGVLDRTAGGCQFMPFAVIFEYGVPKSGCHDIRSWAKQWVNLSTLAIGSSAYNSALEAITEQFVAANASPGKPNGSALNQLRTNENALVVLWELREFKIDPATHLLFEDTVKQTPDETLNNTAVIADYVNANAAAIKLDQHVVPDRFPGNTPFMAASSRASPGQFDTHFRAPGIADNDARFHFSLNTCTACHIRETSTNGNPGGNNSFLHVDTKVMPAVLSRFLTGSTPSITDSPDPFGPPNFVVDPVPTVPLTPNHLFNDLERRRQKLATIAGSNCLRLILVPPRRLFDRLPRIGPGDPLPKISDLRLDGINDPIRMTH